MLKNISKNISILCFYSFLIGIHNFTLAEEVRSSHPESGTLLISDDNYSIEYQNHEGKTFSLYYYNDMFPSRHLDGQQYYVRSFSKNGRFATIERITYIIDTYTEEKNKYYITDFIDLTRGCVLHSLHQKQSSGFWSTLNEASWILAPSKSNPFPQKIDLDKFKHNIIFDAGVNNSYLCNIENILDKNLNIKLLSELQNLIEKHDSKYTFNNDILNLTYPHDIYGLATLVDQSNVDFFNQLALDLLARKSLLDSDPHYLSSIIILESILDKFPNREQIILNLADAYGLATSLSKFQIKSQKLYLEYISIMTTQNRANEIPERAYMKTAELN